MTTLHCVEIGKGGCGVRLGFSRAKQRRARARARPFPVEGGWPPELSTPDAVGRDLGLHLRTPTNSPADLAESKTSRRSFPRLITR